MANKYHLPVHLLAQQLIEKVLHHPPMHSIDIGINCDGAEKLDTDEKQICLKNEINVNQEWQVDSNKLISIAETNFDASNLIQHHESMKIVQKQEKRLREKFYTMIADINNNIVESQVSWLQLPFKFALFFLCVVTSVLYLLYVYKTKQKQLHQAKTNAAAMETKCVEMQKQLMLAQQEFNIVEKQLLQTIKKHENLTHRMNETKCNLNKFKTDMAMHTNVVKQQTTIKTNLTATLLNFREFETSNREAISKIKLKYDKMWKTMEQTWYQWDVKQIILYLRYKCENSYHGKSDVIDIDFDLVAKNMSNDNFKGKYLNSIDKSDLKRFGIKNYQNYTKVDKIIKALCNDNPKLNQRNDDTGQIEGNVFDDGDTFESNDNNNKVKIDEAIDSKYICPITQKIMQCPVVAYCYEKNAIIGYWRQHGKSPITHQKIDDVELVISLLYQNQS